ncbi:MAG: hypothetical protein IPJ75_02330 [Ignavibacteriales bacterium]|nr:hypothetical protein [Ignavibacteriales bacterium]
MEQNEKIDDVQTETMGTNDVPEVSLQKEAETEKVEVKTETAEIDEKENSGKVTPESVEDSPTESLSASKEEEIYQKLKTELMEEIRKYFDPILKEGRPVPEVLQQDETLPVEREDNLINRIIDESGW